jgi:CHAD domain-containing protein
MMASRAQQTISSPARPVRQCRKVFVHQLKCALEELECSKPSIHGARKQLKRARATLRLLRPAIGDDLYRRENVAARDAARPLSMGRDEEILQDTLDKLGAAAPGLRIRKSARQVHARQLGRIKAALNRSMTRARTWRLHADGWECIAAGLRATYRRGRRALRQARSNRDTNDLHEWRKQTKYAWHQLQVLTPVAIGPVGELADEFHHLADYLGDEHDLAILRERAKASVELKTLIDRRREELQDRAFALGERLYAEKPKAFVDGLEQHWVEWQRRERHDT